MLAAAFVPHPPLLVPALGGNGVPEAVPLRAACDAAVGDLVAEAPEVMVCIGTGGRTTRHRPGSWGTLAGFGVAVQAPTPHPAGAPALPLSLTLGRWLLDRAGWLGTTVVQEVAEGAAPGDCAGLGAALQQECGPQAAWLVLGDGTARRSQRAPGYLDPRAAGFDAAVASALAHGDLATLSALDADLASDLGAAGRATWQVLAGAIGQRPVRSARLRYDEAPFGVGYLVAGWWLRR